MPLHVLLISALLLLSLSVKGQREGCTDPQAKNYDPEAVINDGSCIYRNTFYKPQIITSLPDSVNETSGLIYWRNSYWTHNDSQGSAALFRMDTASGNILQRISLRNALNIDWEAIDHDDEFIYIGDFGNNLGNRLDLVIYKIAKDSIPDTLDAGIEASVISFSYGDQSDFTIRNRSNDFDCESMVSFGDSLYLFTKNWASHTSRLYTLPKASGHYVLYPIDEYDVNGLITGATHDPQNDRLVLVGYKNYVPFIWVLSDYWKNDFFGGNKRRIDFPELTGTQTEGITTTGNHKYIISSERTLVSDAKLFRMNLNEIE